jgi:hypothetical protein
MNRAPVFKPLYAFVAVAVALLQLVGALHYSLVQHGYSAALGGVVHLHARAAAKPRARVAQAVALVSAEAPSCGAELCSVASAPQSPALYFEAAVAGHVSFGEARLLGRALARSAEARRVILSAPKTSPPV